MYRKYLRVHDVQIMLESVVRAASNPATYRRKIEKADEKAFQKLVESEHLEESLNAQLDQVCLLFDSKFLCIIPFYREIAVENICN